MVDKEQLLYQRSIIMEEYFEQKKDNNEPATTMNIYKGLPRKKRILRKLSSN